MSMRARVAGAWALLHPGPSLATVLAFMICAFIAARGQPNLATLGLATLGLVCQQFAISALNDYCDRASDALLPHKRKPIVLGLVSPGFALGAAIVLTIGMFACFVPLGWGPTLLASWFLALGFAYDLGIKSTPLSGVMHGLAFPTIPLLAWVLFATLRPALFWAFPLGMAVGIGIHLADALPDAEADDRAGVHGLVQALGNRALPGCWVAIGSAIAILAGLAIAQTQHHTASAVLLGTVLVAGILLSGAIRTVHGGRHPAIPRLKQHFHLLVAAALVLVAGWFTSITLS